MIIIRTLALAAMLSATHSALAAGALRQAYVSTTGSDASGCGASGAPCRTFAYALANAVAPGGVLYAQKPGDYGSAVITRAVTIVNVSGGVAGIMKFDASSNEGFRIAAASNDKITLQGLTFSSQVDTYGSAVVVASGKATIVNCAIANVHYGIIAADVQGFEAAANIYNTSITRARQNGVLISPNGRGGGVTTGRLHKVTVSQSAYGLQGRETYSTLSVTDSTFSGNVYGMTGSIKGDNVKLIGNDIGFRYGASRTEDGVWLNASFARSNIVGNRIGVELTYNLVTMAAETFNTYKNNVIEGNSGGDIVGDASNVKPKPLQ